MLHRKIAREIEAHLLTLLKFLRQDNRFHYIAGGSLLEAALSEATSIPMGSIRNTCFPFAPSRRKNLMKIYLNDVGILSGVLYGTNIRAVLDDQKSINLGAVYECVIASELIAHGYPLFYYDKRRKGDSSSIQGFRMSNSKERLIVCLQQESMIT